MRMEGESVKEIWENLKKGVKECETKREIIIRKKGSASIAGGMQSVKGKREKYTRRTESGRKGDKIRRSICVGEESSERNARKKKREIESG